MSKFDALSNFETKSANLLNLLLISYHLHATSPFVTFQFPNININGAAVRTSEVGGTLDVESEHFVRRQI
jgi:hypothetical protein